MAFRLKFSPKLLIGLLITIFFGIALFIRIYYPYDQVFVGDWIKFTTNDAYYQMRLVDNMVYNFPHITAFDPYLIYPGGGGYGSIHFFNWLLSFVIWIGGLGSPTQHTVDIIAVYFPVVLAALTVIPVYFMGKALFNNRWAGVIAAGLIAVMPGEFVGRSLLGGTDQHVAETLFTAVAAMFVIFAVKSGWKNQLSWDHVVKRDWKVLLKPLLFSLLGGLFLGIYLITWLGGLLFVFIITAYFIIQFVIDHLKGQSTFYLGFTGFIIFLIAFLIFRPLSPTYHLTFAVIIAFLIPPVMAAVSRLISWRGYKAFYYPVALVVIAGVFLVVFNLVKPVLLQTMLSQFSIFTPGGATGATTIEMQPFLSPSGTFTTAVGWGNYTTSFFLIPSDVSVNILRWFPGWAIIPIVIAVWLWIKHRSAKTHQQLLLVLVIVSLLAAVSLWFITPASWKLTFPGIAPISLVVLIVLFIKRRSDEKQLLFLFVWTLIILIATLTQRRFAYYLVVNISLLSGYLCWQIIRFFAIRKPKPEGEESVADKYRRARNIGIIGGIILLIASPWILNPIYFFVPVFVCAYAALFYGCWAWGKSKGKGDLWALWAIITPLGFIPLAFSKDQYAKDKTKKRSVATPSLPLLGFNIAILVVIVFTIAFWTNFNKSKDVASQVAFAPPDAWEESVHWLKDNTPEPLGADAYYALYDAPPPGGSFTYPDSAYGVTAWWDYGYWIMRTAQRLPSDNPSQSGNPIITVANLFLSQDQAYAQQMMTYLDSSYVVLDYAVCTTKLWAVATWIGQDASRYIITYYFPYENKLVPVQVFSPEYYKLLCVRLYNFDGKASTGEKPVVITYDNMTDKSGAVYRQATNVEEFDSYQSALNYVNTRPDGNYAIAGSSPFVNPIPIDAVLDYQLVFSSSIT
ncbi:MAG: hypothetical protein A2Y90_00955, partial [Chloroflexi bacterium RBG_13_52_12]